ncbi:MAG: hypothetical protein XXXJIFNMEKO3_02673 [Candidatus Erwinia impunctatus]
MAYASSCFFDALKKQVELIDVENFILMYEKERILLGSGNVVFSAVSKLNLRKLLVNVNEFYSESKEYKPNLYKLAYILATTRHETYHFTTGEHFSDKPEIGTFDYFNQYDPVLAVELHHRNRAMSNGSTQCGDGFKYRDRGCSHLTSKNNYQKTKDKFLIDFVTMPDLACDLNMLSLLCFRA